MNLLQTDEELAREAAREGSDGPAFVELLHRYQQRVWRICYRLLGNAEDAQDAAQEVFVRLFTTRAAFAGRSSYSTWVHGIAVRTSLTLRRGRSRRQQRQAALREATNPAHAAEAVEEGQSLDLTAMLDTLAEEERAMLILKYAEDYSYEELAPIFDLTISACKMRISRARDKLKRAFPEQTAELYQHG